MTLRKAAVATVFVPVLANLLMGLINHSHLTATGMALDPGFKAQAAQHGASNA